MLKVHYFPACLLIVIFLSVPSFVFDTILRNDPENSSVLTILSLSLYSCWFLRFSVRFVLPVRMSVVWLGSRLSMEIFSRGLNRWVIVFCCYCCCFMRSSISAVLIRVRLYILVNIFEPTEFINKMIFDVCCKAHVLL